MKATTSLQPFEPTWVEYDAQDPFGAVLALVTLSPVFIMVMYATLVVFQRDLDAMALLVGQLLNEVLNQLLKRTIKQSRPHGARMSGAGMPSAHAQFLGFFAAYVVAYTLQRMDHRRRTEKALTIAGAIVLAALVCVSRVRLGYHTIEQVAVGNCRWTDLRMALARAGFQRCPVAVPPDRRIRARKDVLRPGHLAHSGPHRVPARTLFPPEANVDEHVKPSE
ncbi:hypothetical protein PINS_up010833 [Pythium insidiosum]|nr:hypothetical protein PINS_up010833 [Pythium insidiosum]